MKNFLSLKLKYFLKQDIILQQLLKNRDLLLAMEVKAFFLIESEQKIIDTRNPSFINESKSSDR